MIIFFKTVQMHIKHWLRWLKLFQDHETCFEEPQEIARFLLRFKLSLQLDKKIKEISIYFSIRYLRIGRLLEVKAGIAQLVEQATENRRVPSSNLGPGTINKHLIGAFLMAKTPHSYFLRILLWNYQVKSWVLTSFKYVHLNIKKHLQQVAF